MKLQILGTGCPKCEQLKANTEAAANELGLDYEIVKISGVSEIMEFGVMMTPALAIDGEVKLVGKTGSVEDIKKLLEAV